MYDIRQFRPTLYLLIALGFTGFAVATISPLPWILGMAGLFLNVWLVRTGRFRPLPRFVANIATLAAAGFTAMDAMGDPRPIFSIGNFLLALQLIKLYEQRANRDYAQILVLSLLLMVAAAISTASLLFGILFLVYLLVSPYACLLFHLKVETDHAKRLMGLDEKNADPMTLKQDQRFLNTSMARMTAVVATFATVTAVLVFLFFPRSSSANMLGWQFRPPVSATGLNDNMDMQSVSRVQQNTTQVGTVTITRGGAPITSGFIYLRGNVYDEYNINSRSGTRWSWARSSSRRRPDFSRLMPWLEKTFPDYAPGASRPSDEYWVQEFTPLQPINVPFLVGIGRASSLLVQRPIRVGMVSSDSVLQLDAPLFAPLNYRVTSTLPIVASAGANLEGRNRNASRDDDDDDDTRDDGGAISNNRPIPGVTPRVAAYARLPEVGGTTADGKPLVDTLGEPGLRPPLDAEKVAQNIERHLQQTFSYTLDLSDSRSKDDSDDLDPIERFLYDTKRGWCEHFAGAMTLMCQSVGLRARLVSGYKCDEFNAVGGYFIVRQSQAHAWVEVLVRDGDRDIWKTFDPTSGREATAAATSPDAFTKLKHFFDYLEHTWATSVVAYDSSSQTSLLDTVENKMVNASIQATGAVRDRGSQWNSITEWFSQLNTFSVSAYVIVSLIVLITAIGIGLILWYVIGRVRLMRRARRIGLGGLEADEARRLARQLGFYDELMNVLEQRRIVCPPHLTPLEFSRSLEFLSEEAYDAVVRLTEIFYRVRFGNTELSHGQRRALGRVVDRLRTTLLPDAKQR